MNNLIGFGDFKIPLGKLAPLSEFRTRANERLRYRLYPGWSENLLILFHGIAGDSRIFAALASAIAESGAAQVVTPDFRGHGLPVAPAEAIAVAKPGQLEEDFEELLVHLRQTMPATRLWVGGHSFGGGFALRLLCDTSEVHGGFVWAPLLPAKDGSGPPDQPGWLAREKNGEQIRINVPGPYRSAGDVTLYDRSFFGAGLAPNDWRARWGERMLSQPGRFLQVFAGGADQIFPAAAVNEAVAGVPGIECESLGGLSHMGVVQSPVAIQRAVFTLVQRSS